MKTNKPMIRVRKRPKIHLIQTKPNPLIQEIKTEKSKAQTKNQNPVLLSGTNLLHPPEENIKSSASDTEMSNPSKSNEIGINNNVPNSQTLDPFAPLSPFP